MLLPEGFRCEFEGLEKGLSEPPSVSVRVNASKGIKLAEGAGNVPWCNTGIYLESRQQFTFDPAMHQGLYYVQDASSMIYAHVVKLLTEENPVNYLDACAAPGGKTTAAIDSLPDGSLVVANEYVYQRAEILAENIIKWGRPGCIVSRGDTARFRKTGAIFDIIAADVPCSGEGMFRKDSEAVAQWTPQLVEECSRRQREIIENLWQALRPGGYLIYSTCTFNRKENEEIASFILDNFDAVPVNPHFKEEWNIIKRDECYHFIPGVIKGEGLTIAIFRKGGEDSDNPKKSASRTDKKKTSKKSPVIPREITEWIINPEKFRITADDDKIIASIPSKDADAVLAACDTIYKGVEIATVKGRDLIPTQALAMSTILNRDAFTSKEVDYHTAIAYLRRETIILEDAPRGFVLLYYNGHPLGFVKNLGNRANNLYPANWKILSCHIPDSPPQVI